MKSVIKKYDHSILALVTVLIISACGTSGDPEIIEETAQKEGIEYRVSGEALSRLNLPEPGVDTSRTVPVIDYPDENVIEFVIGPQEIPANTNHLWYPAMVSAVPFDLWVQGFDWEITDENKKPLATDILHHVNIIDPNRRELFYPIARRLFAASNDTPGGKMPEFIGVPLKKDDPLLMNVMFQNPTDSVLKNIYLRVYFDYTDRSAIVKPVDVYPLYLDAGGVLLPRDFKVPSGEFVKGDTASPAVSGRILAAGSHMHNYGQVLKLVDVTSGETIHTFEPEKSGEGYVKSSPAEIFLPFGKKVKDDHRYAIVAIYNNPLEKPSPDMGMGTIGGLFLPTDGENWANADFNSQLYRDDMVMMLSAPHIKHWHGMSADEMLKEMGIAAE